MLGALFETWVYHHILALSEIMPTAPHIYHWRTHSGAQVDLVLEWNNFLYPIEIKARSHVSKKDVSGIKAFFETYPKQVRTGLVMYAGDTCFQLMDNVLALPCNSIVAPGIY